AGAGCAWRRAAMVAQHISERIAAATKVHIGGDRGIDPQPGRPAEVDQRTEADAIVDLAKATHASGTASAEGLQLGVGLRVEGLHVAEASGQVPVEAPAL